MWTRQPFILAVLMLAYAGIVLGALVVDLQLRHGYDRGTVQTVSLGPHMTTAVDPTGKKTLPDMLAEGQPAFSDASQSGNRGVAPTASTAFWLKIDPPRLSESVQNWILSLKLTRVRQAELYVPDSAGFRRMEWHRGDPDQLYRYPLFVLGANDVRSGSIYLRTNTHSSMRAMVQLMPLNLFLSADESEALALGGLTGVLVGLAVYVGVMAFTMRDKIFAWLAAMIVAFTCYLVADCGLLDADIMPGFITLSTVVSLSATILVYSALLGFSRRWLEVDRWSPRLAVALKLASLICLALAVEAAREMLMDEQIVRRFSSELGLVVLLGCILTALAALWHRRLGGVLFLACWLPAIGTGAIRLGLDAWPGLGASPLLSNAVYFGSTLSLLCFSTLASYNLQARERRLRQSAELMQARFRNFAGSAADSFWETTETGEISYLEGPQVSELGLSKGERLTEGLARTSIDGAEAVASIGAALATGTAFRDVPVPVKSAGDTSKLVLVSGVAARDLQGRISGFAGAVVDATAQQERSERLARQEKMAALGQLSAYMAHEINNLLHPMVNLARRLQQRHATDEQTQNMTDIMLDAAQRMDDILVSIKRATTLEPADIAEHPLAHAVRRSLQTIRAALPAHVGLTTEVHDIEEVQVSSGEMLQLLSNLIANAVRAIDGSGEIVVRLARAAETGAVRLSVCDTGCGMSEETRRRAFEPFFTTRSANGGTGLGLSVVSGILKGWGAKADVVSSPGAGTSVNITFATEGSKQ